MAAPLGFKTFATGDVLTAADTNGYLMQGIWAFANAAARDAAVTSPQEGNFCYLKDTNATQFYTGSAWSAVGGGGGKVLQVVQGTTTTAVSNSTNTPADTTLTATITPSSATSKVLVLVTQNGMRKTDANSGNRISLNLVRGATTIAQMALGDGFTNSALNLQLTTSAINYLDTPATTSATTYKTTFYNFANTAAVNVQVNGSEVSTITLMEIGA